MGAAKGNVSGRSRLQPHTGPHAKPLQPWLAVQCAGKVRVGPRNAPGGSKLRPHIRPAIRVLIEAKVHVQLQHIPKGSEVQPRAKPHMQPHAKPHVQPHAKPHVQLRKAGVREDATLGSEAVLDPKAVYTLVSPPHPLTPAPTIII